MTPILVRGHLKFGWMPLRTRLLTCEEDARAWEIFLRRQQFELRPNDVPRVIAAELLEVVY